MTVSIITASRVPSSALCGEAHQMKKEKACSPGRAKGCERIEPERCSIATTQFNEHRSYKTSLLRCI